MRVAHVNHRANDTTRGVYFEMQRTIKGPPAAVARLMADDAVYEDVALGRVLRGQSEIASFVEEATRSSSDFRFENVSLFTAGSDYANEWIMLGTNDREVGGGVPATGRSFRVRGASIWKTRSEWANCRESRLLQSR
jgi:steroid delta-isomerase-like uncharacterized protein